ncbi:MAG: hypothetical protein AABW47_02800 [Nanoarchaeota archaeon]
MGPEVSRLQLTMIVDAAFSCRDVKEFKITNLGEKEARENSDLFERRYHVGLFKQVEPSKEFPYSVLIKRKSKISEGVYQNA